MSPKKPWTLPFSIPDADCRPAGYAWLVEKYELDVLPHWRWTFVSERHIYRELERDGARVFVVPPARWPGEADLDHLLFALKTDGVSLPIWRALVATVDLDALAATITGEVRRTPTGAYARRAWFLFEQLTGRALPLPDVRQGNYVPLLSPEVHVTGPVRKHRRQRIDVNLLGSLAFAPTVRWTPGLAEASADHLAARIAAVVSGYDDHTLRRAISYLYTRETMASYEIEHERPPHTRAERFIASLREASRLPTLDAGVLLDLQNTVVDPRFADDGWRHEQIYVGEPVDLVRQRVHFVGPRAGDLPELMDGFLAMTRHLVESDSPDPVVAAAVASFGFVLLHPFSDGNGRIHRWLVHWVLARRGVTPARLVIPVSAVMLSHRREYDEALESFSAPLMTRVAYDLSAEGRLTVHGDTVDWYRHPDLTSMAEGLWRWLGLAVDRELPAQLRFLVGFDGARRAIQEIVDLPDRLLTLFVQVVLSNGGHLSRKKRDRHFAMLTDDEVAAMERALQEHFEEG